MTTNKTENKDMLCPELSHSIVGAAKVHKRLLRPGLSEKAKKENGNEPRISGM
jgi:hypothetical protein